MKIGCVGMIMGLPLMNRGYPSKKESRKDQPGRHGFSYYSNKTLIKHNQTYDANEEY